MYFEYLSLPLNTHWWCVIQQMVLYDAMGTSASFLMWHYCQHDSSCFILFMLCWMVKVWIVNGVLNRIPAAAGAYEFNYIQPLPQSSWTRPPAGSIPSAVSVAELLETFLYPTESSRCFKGAWFSFLFSRCMRGKAIWRRIHAALCRLGGFLICEQLLPTPTQSGPVTIPVR